MSLQLVFLNAILRFTIKRRLRRNPDVMELRAIMSTMQPPRVPAQIAVESMILEGVAVEKLSAESAAPDYAVLYLHGGGFVAGAPANHRALTWRLAEMIGVPVYAVDYRLAPEHKFPAGLEDCVAAYRGLLEAGIAANSIVVGGDSAGGNLTLALALKLKQLGLPQPAALVCLSPVTDLSVPSPSHLSNARADAMFDPRSFATLPASYCPGHDLRDPLLSPVYGDLAGLPPVLFQCSDAEMLRDDSVRMADALRQAGVRASLQIWPRVFHVWQVTADQLPEARAAIAKIAGFVREELGL